MLKVVVRSFLNFDGYDLVEDTNTLRKNHTIFKIDEVDKLREAISGKEVIWEKGINTFTGAKIDNELYEQMVRLVIGE